MRTVIFKKWKCYARYARYGNGRTAIQLFDKKTHEPIATATVNVVTFEDLGPDEVIIKDYSENQGMLASLQNAGIVGDAKQFIQTGYVQVPVCNLLVNVEYENSKIKS